jgi:4-hydroxy-3-polyprenylbenzoate decarboxylase
VPGSLVLPKGFTRPQVALPGILVIEGQAWSGRRGELAADLAAFCRELSSSENLQGLPLIVVVDDSAFASRTLNNFLWVAFTRSDPASDIDGIDAFTRSKHWGCHGSLVMDARIKTHHAPPLIDDPAVERRIDALGAKGGPLHGIV